MWRSNNIKAIEKIVENYKQAGIDINDLFQLMHLLASKVNTGEIEQKDADAYLCKRVDKRAAALKNEFGKTLLHDASQYGFVDTLKKLIKFGGLAHCASCPTTPLQLACKLGQLESAKVLLAAGVKLKSHVKLTTEDNNEFHTAFAAGGAAQIKVAELIIRERNIFSTDILYSPHSRNKDDLLPIEILFQHPNRYAMLEMLINNLFESQDAEKHVNWKDDKGNTKPSFEDLVYALHDLMLGIQSIQGNIFSNITLDEPRTLEENYFALMALIIASLLPETYSKHFNFSTFANYHTIWTGANLDTPASASNSITYTEKLIELLTTDDYDRHFNHFSQKLADKETLDKMIELLSPYFKLDDLDLPNSLKSYFLNDKYNKLQKHDKLHVWVHVFAVMHSDISLSEKEKSIVAILLQHHLFNDALLVMVAHNAARGDKDSTELKNLPKDIAKLLAAFTKFAALPSAKSAMQDNDNNEPPKDPKQGSTKP